MKRDELLRIRALIEKGAAVLSDEEALEAPTLFPTWQSDTEYAVGERRRYNGELYKCVQAHTSQPDWTPPETPALWTKVAEPGSIPVWVQPTGAQDAYMTGDKVHYPDEAGPVYVSTVDNNVWAPDVYGWEREGGGRS